MTKITNLNLPALIKTPGRYRVGDGMFLKVLDEHRAYFVYRYRVDGREHEASLGSARKITLAEANNRHLAMLKSVRVDKRDPLADKRAAKARITASAAAKPTFGERADAYVATHEASWRSPKSAEAWRMTLTDRARAIRDTPVDKIDTAAVMRVLEPIWAKTPETASRLRGRIEAVIASAQALGHIDPDRANPARWKGHLDKLLPKPKKLGKIDPTTGVRATKRGNYAAMPYKDAPAFMATLSTMPGTAAKALAFVILTAVRTGEALGAQWSEIDLDDATWTIPANRMKAEQKHRVPLSDQALAILRGQMAARGKNPHVFPSHLPKRPLSQPAMLEVLRRMKVDVTVHGFRSSFRDWAGDETHFQREVAEAALAHAIGDASEQAYRRGDALDKRRELMDAWASFVMPKPDAKVTKPNAKVVKLQRVEA
jgi:integrase